MKGQPDVNRIRLVLLQDYVLLRASLARLLASDTRFDVVGECGSSSEALELISGRQADVVLSDLDLGGDAVTTLISAARAGGYQGRFLIIAGMADAESVALAIKCGASGIFLKSEAPERLVQAITFVANGSTWIDPSLIQLLAAQCVDRPTRPVVPSANGALDARQRKVLTGILGGLTNRKIGEVMGVSEGTVKNILQGLFSKTGVRKRSQLVRLALEGSLGKLS
jgi:DNA-binding NarL/FixJ family response regulator